MYRQPENFSLNVRRSLVTLLLSPILITGSTFAQEKAPEKITYDDHAKPILVQRCSTCHSASKREGDLDVTNYTNYANANRDATPMVDPAITADPAIYPDASIVARLNAGILLPPKEQRLRTRVWSRVKTGI